MQRLVTFLKSNGNRQAILSETGGGNTASCETAYVTLYTYFRIDSMIPYLVWNLSLPSSRPTQTQSPVSLSGPRVHSIRLMSWQLLPTEMGLTNHSGRLLVSWPLAKWFFFANYTWLSSPELALTNYCDGILTYSSSLLACVYFVV